MSTPSAQRLSPDPVPFPLPHVHDAGMPWKTIAAGAGARRLSVAHEASNASSGYVFFAVADARADQAGLGRFWSTSTAMHRDLLAAALKSVGGVDVAQVKKHLLMLCAANQACCNEKAPAALHLYMGLGSVNAQDSRRAAKLLRELCQVAFAIRGALNDRACEQMLEWIGAAWAAHAKVLEDGARSATPAFFLLSPVEPEVPASDTSSALCASAEPRGLQDSGIPWKTVGDGADPGEPPTSSGSILFFAVRDGAALEAGLGCISSAHVIAHRNRLARALKTGAGPEKIFEHLLALSAANKGSCRETDPKKLHLYMGLGSVKKRDLPSAARFLRDLCASAQTTRGQRHDRDGQQMLSWIVRAWKDHATLLENKAPQSAETTQDATEGYAFTRIVALNTMTTTTGHPVVICNTSTSAATSTAVAGATPRTATAPEKALALERATASEELRDLLLRKSIGKAQVKHLARLTHARMMTTGDGDKLYSQVSRDELKTMHKHLGKVIAHLSARASADSIDLHALRYVHGKLQHMLDDLR